MSCVLGDLKLGRLKTKRLERVKYRLLTLLKKTRMFTFMEKVIVVTRKRKRFKLYVNIDINRSVDI